MWQVIMRMMMMESVLTRQQAAAGPHLPLMDKPELFFFSLSPNLTEPPRSR